MRAQADKVVPCVLVGAWITLSCGFAAASPTWTSTDSLNGARSGHNATLLHSGKVLVVGGDTDNFEALVTAELYDPVTRTWTVTGRLNVARRGGSFTATLLPGGKVLVAGGSDVDYGADTAELYDPVTGSWTLTSAPKIRRGYHTATLLSSGKILLAGGIWDEDRDELYDPVTETWSVTGKLNEGRFGHSATLLPDGRVLVAGGFVYLCGDPSCYADPPAKSLATAELYDPLTGTWSRTGSMQQYVGGHTATLLPTGKVLIAGGNSGVDGGYAYVATSQLFDPDAGQWTQAGNLIGARVSHTATLLSDGSVLVVGGYGDPASSTLKSAELYDSSTGRWTSAGDMGDPRASLTATLLANGTVLVAGGNKVTSWPYTRTFLRSAELFGIASSTGAFGAGFTGSWYDPAQNGHGFMLEVLPGSPMRLLVGWFTFGPQGGQSWITGVGQVDGNQAMVPVYQMVGSGGRFPPNFDPANVHQESWGTLTFTFSDCNHGRVDWMSTAPGYGGGSIDLTRLTLPSGLSC